MLFSDFLPFSRIAIAALGFLVFRVLYQIVYYRFCHPLSSFPGPFWASVTRLWIAYHCYKGEERFVQRDELQKHGILNSSSHLDAVNVKDKG